MTTSVKTRKTVEEFLNSLKEHWFSSDPPKPPAINMSNEHRFLEILQEILGNGNFTGSQLLARLHQTVTSPAIVVQCFNFIKPKLNPQVLSQVEAVRFYKRIVRKQVCKDKLMQMMSDNNCIGAVPWYALLYLLIQCPRNSNSFNSRSSLPPAQKVIPVLVDDSIRYAVLSHTQTPANPRWILTSLVNSCPLTDVIPEGHTLIMCES